MQRGLWLLAVSHQHTEDMGQMFTKANVKLPYRVAVPRLTRQEVYAQLQHYMSSGNLFMLQGAWQAAGSDFFRAARHAHRARAPPTPILPPCPRRCAPD
jgi:hypothetical protein